MKRGPEPLNSARIAAPTRSGVISGALASKLSRTVAAVATTALLSIAPASWLARVCDWTVGSPATAAATLVRKLLSSRAISASLGGARSASPTIANASCIASRQRPFRAVIDEARPVGDVAAAH